MPESGPRSPKFQRETPKQKEGIVRRVPSVIPEVVNPLEGFNDNEILGLERILNQLSEAGILVSDSVDVEYLPEAGRLLTMIADGYLREPLQQDKMPMAARPVEDSRGWFHGRPQAPSKLSVRDIRRGIRESKEDEVDPLD